MSKELEIKCPSGAAISFTGVESEDYFKGLDDATLLRALGEYNNTDHGEDFKEFDLFEKTAVQMKRSSKERKIWKLKRLNVKFGQQRRALYNQMITLSNNSELFTSTLIAYTLRIGYISEKIGNNSAKIQRLRTQIQQEKKLNEHSSGA